MQTPTSRSLPWSDTAKLSQHRLMGAPVGGMNADSAAANEADTAQADGQDDGRPDARVLLMEAAAKLYAERSKVSVREIAQEAGVNHGLVHYYFGSKEKLRVAAIDHVLNQMAAQLHIDASSTDEEIVDAMMKLYADATPMLRLGFRALIDNSEGGMFSGREYPILHRLVDVVTPHARREGAKAISLFLAGIIGGVVFSPWLLRATGMSADAFNRFSRDRHIALLRKARAISEDAQ